MASRILTSTFLATISAAFPLGALIKGTRPEKVVDIRKRRSVLYNIPRVATTLNSPLATLSISSSICCSVEEGEFKIM